MPASFEPPPLESDEPPLTVEQLRKLAPEQLAHALAIAQTASEWVGRRTKATLDRGTQVFALFSSSSFFVCLLTHPFFPICHTPFSPYVTPHSPHISPNGFQVFALFFFALGLLALSNCLGRVLFSATSFGCRRIWRCSKSRRAYLESEPVLGF